MYHVVSWGCRGHLGYGNSAKRKQKQVRVEQATRAENTIGDSRDDSMISITSQIYFVTGTRIQISSISIEQSAPSCKSCLMSYTW